MHSLNILRGKSDQRLHFCCFLFLLGGGGLFWRGGGFVVVPVFVHIILVIQCVCWTAWTLQEVLGHGACHL